MGPCSADSIRASRFLTDCSQPDRRLHPTARLVSFVAEQRTSSTGRRFGARFRPRFADLGLRYCLRKEETSRLRSCYMPAQAGIFA